MVLRQLRVAFSHLDIRMPENLCEFEEVAAVHHVPGRKRVPQTLRGKNAILSSPLLRSGGEYPGRSIVSYAHVRNLIYTRLQ